MIGGDGYKVGLTHCFLLVDSSAFFSLRSTRLISFLLSYFPLYHSHNRQRMIKSSRSPPFLTYIRTRTFSSSSSRTTSLSKSRLKSLPPSSTHPTPSEFYQSYLEPKTPGLLKGLVHPSSSSKPNPYAWTSIDSWSKLDENGIETLDGRRNQETEELIVPVEIGKPNRGYMEGQTEAQKGKRDGSPGWESIQMPFGEILSRLRLGFCVTLGKSENRAIRISMLTPTLPCPCISASIGLFLDAFVARRIPWTSSSQDIIGYMAQHDLLSSVSSLQRVRKPTLERNEQDNEQQDKELVVL